MTPLQLPAAELGEAGGIAAIAGVTALAGLFVAYQAYRGYRRNESRPMLYLAAGVLLLTTVPVGLNALLAVLPGVTEARILLAITAAHFAGVLSILYALTRA